MAVSAVCLCSVEAEVEAAEPEHRASIYVHMHITYVFEGDDKRGQPGGRPPRGVESGESRGAAGAWSEILAGFREKTGWLDRQFPGLKMEKGWLCEICVFQDSVIE